jgi:hypothetical protein
MEGGIVYITTPDVSNPWELMQFEEDGQWESYDEETFRLLTRELGFGSAYLRDREVIESECKERGRRLNANNEMSNFKEFKKD